MIHQDHQVQCPYSCFRRAWVAALARESVLRRQQQMQRRRVRVSREEGTLRRALMTYQADMQNLKQAVSAQRGVLLWIF